jgi:hypothetical protein
MWRHFEMNFLTMVTQTALLVKAGRAEGALPGPARVKLGVPRQLPRAPHHRGAVRVAALILRIFMLAKMAVELEGG